MTEEIGLLGDVGGEPGDGEVRRGDFRGIEFGVETTSSEEPVVRVEQAADPLVSIVVVTYGTGAVILDALSALARSTSIAVEIVIVDNPVDGTGDERFASRELLRSRTSGVRLVTPQRRRTCAS